MEEAAGSLALGTGETIASQTFQVAWRLFGLHSTHEIECSMTIKFEKLPIVNPVFISLQVGPFGEAMDGTMLPRHKDIHN